VVLLGSACTTILQVRAPLKPVALVEHPQLTEGSGLVESSTRPGTFWAINDSGNDPDLFLMDAEGRDLGRVRVNGVENRDWETLAVDEAGGLWIGDIGNNANRRRDLTVLRVQEPSASSPLPQQVEVDRRLVIRYPDQLHFPPERKNFDGEAMFSFQGALYILTKHRADRDTNLYRLDLDVADGPQEMVWLERAEEVGQVTGCDLHRDGRQLAVLTYSGVWVFTRPEDSDRFLSGEVRHFHFPAWSLLQAEAIAWAGEDELLITNEQRNIYRISLGQFEHR
jgi:hypothetical protein